MPSFGPTSARLLILGLAPGKFGAHRTGRAFTGDASGAFLFSALTETGFACGTYAQDGTDDVALVDCMITNAVRCLPPDNKPTAAELAACRPHLAARLAALPNLKAILCVGRVAHDAALRVRGLSLARHPFAHGALHRLDALALFDSYHCSRYNVNTGRLTRDMFLGVLTDVRRYLGTAT